jgi:hypothetical protein
MANFASVLACLLLALAMAGCTGNDSAKTDSASSSSSHTPSSLLDTNITANGTSNGTSASAMAQRNEWRHDNRSGSISGNALIVSNPPPKSEDFTIANGTAALVVNASADGNGVHVTLRPPGCDKADCEVEVGDATSGKNATLELTQPKDGDWSVMLTVMGGPGPVSSKYVLDLAQEVVVMSAGASASTNYSSSSTTTTGP